MRKKAIAVEAPWSFDIESGLDPSQSKKQAVVTLRWLLVIAAAYLMLFTGPEWPGMSVAAIVVLLLASNVVLQRLPEEMVSHSAFDLGMLMFDTAVLSLGFYLQKTISTDFYLLYFFVIFLAGVSEKLTSVLMGSVLASAAYLWLGWNGLSVSTGGAMGSSPPLRVFFIFAVALFYGFLVERIRLDREKSQAEYVGRLETVNARLRELVELRQAFVGAVSHELRTPLNAMLGYMGLVLDGSVGEVKGTVWSYIDKAYRRGLQLTRLIEDLLSISSISRGSVSVQREETDLHEVFERIWVSAKPPAQAKNLELRMEIAPDLQRFRTDGAKLSQVLLHLVLNATKFTDSGEICIRGRVTDGKLRSGWKGPLLECVVQDTGPGIPADQRDAIFEEFRQLDGSMTRRHGGMGLGLSVCRGLVQLLGGEITVDSVVGSGSAFAVRLPYEPVKASTDDESFVQEPLAAAGGARS